MGQWMSARLHQIRETFPSSMVTVRVTTAARTPSTRASTGSRMTPAPKPATPPTVEPTRAAAMRTAQLAGSGMTRGMIRRMPGMRWSRERPCRQSGGHALCHRGLRGHLRGDVVRGGMLGDVVGHPRHVTSSLLPGRPPSPRLTGRAAAGRAAIEARIRHQKVTGGRQPPGPVRVIPGEECAMPATLTAKRHRLADVADAIEFCMQQGWTDGLPVIPPPRTGSAPCWRRRASIPSSRSAPSPTGPSPSPPRRWRSTR